LYRKKQMAASPTMNLDEYYGLAIYKAKKAYHRLPEPVRSKIELNDLIQESFIGLVEAAGRYNPQKGASFATYSNFRIEGALRDFLRRQDPLTQKERAEVKTLERAEEEILRSSSARPSVAELSAALGISEDEVRSIRRLKKIFFSFEEIFQTNDTGPVNISQELPAIENPDPQPKIVRKELWQDVNECLKNALIDYERAVLLLRTLGELTLKKTAQILNLDINKVHRIEKKAGSKMKHCLKDKGWEPTDIIEIFTE
jgi:RNA polymerase sigma factor for flagellar operon FliA